MDKLLAMDISNDLRHSITSLDTYKSCVSDMEKINEYDKRRSGRTTRIIDGAILELLDKDSVLVADHTGTSKMAKHRLDTVSRRIQIEHNRLATGFVDNVNGSFYANIKLNDRK